MPIDKFGVYRRSAATDWPKRVVRAPKRKASAKRWAMQQNAGTSAIGEDAAWKRWLAKK